MAELTYTFEVSDNALRAAVWKICKDPATLYEAHNLFAKMCDPYVPFLEGALATNGIANVSAEGITYNTPYARYQYYLHDMEADLAGTTNRTREFHPLASSYWDKAMLSQKRDAFEKQLQEIIARRLKDS